MLFSATVPTGIQTDYFYITLAGVVTVTDGSCTTAAGCFASAEAQQDLVVVSGYIAGTITDVTVARKAVTTDSGLNDAVINAAFMGITIYYHTASFALINLLAPLGSHVAVPLSSQKFLQTQQCATSCATCSGSLITDCLTCGVGFALSKSAQGKCLVTTIVGCAAGTCTKCEAGNTSNCLMCTSAMYVPYLGVCVMKFPPMWNKISFALANFTVYYGFDTTNANLHFRITGNNQGWIGLSFLPAFSTASKHLNTDMMILRKMNGLVLIEDRFSLT